MPISDDIERFESENRKLRMEWHQSYGCNQVDFIYDGPTDSRLWFNSKYRILCLLKEAHGGGTWDHAEAIHTDLGLLRVGGTANQATHYRMVEWLYAIERTLNGQSVDIEEERRTDYPECRAVMLRSAWINIKKANGVSHSDANDLSIVVRRDHIFLKKQIDMLNPQIILCCATFEIARDPLFSNCARIQGTKFSYRSEGRVIVNYRHPARASRETYMPLMEEARMLREAWPSAD